MPSITIVRRGMLVSGLSLVMLAGCATTSRDRVSSPSVDTAELHRVLESFHEAAHVGDAARYFGHLADDAVFLGTDPSERWSKAEFESFATPYFADGHGWTYTPRERQVDLSADGRLAWFDELLENHKYGTCRGSGVLVQEHGQWRIIQYNLSFVLPNDKAEAALDVVYDRSAD